MACIYHKSALAATTAADQAVAAAGLIDFDTNSVLTGCAITHAAGSNSITLAKPGLYFATFNGDLSPTAAGDVTMQLIGNTVNIPGAEATVTGAAGDTYTANFSKVIRVLPSCCAVDNTTVLQVQVSAAATISNANINVVKLA